jgi:hypothetical protein
MQTLGLADFTPRSESRWRALFWPSIRNDADYDYVTHQGFWICIAVSLTTVVTGLVGRDARNALPEAIFFVLAAMGVRERIRVAAVAAFVTYLFRAFVITHLGGAGFGFTRIFFLALLFANIRGSWLCERWPRNPSPLRLSRTFAEKLSDQLPRWLWPKARVLFYVFATAELTLLVAALG